MDMDVKSDKKTDFKCISDNFETIPDLIAKNFEFPKAHTNLEDMINLSKAMKDSKKDIFCRVPFCNTVEAEAFGAIIKLGDNKYGPRVEKYIINSNEELANFETLVDLTMRKGRITNVLSAVNNLSASGEYVILNICGPFTVISALMDPKIFYKEIRKNPENAKKLIDYIEQGIINYMIEGVKNGAKIISYSDSVGTLDIVGPRIFKNYSGISNKRIIEQYKLKLAELSDFNEYNVILHVCGKLSSSFENTEIYTHYPITMDSNGKNYGEILLDILNTCNNIGSDVNVLGNACIKKTSSKSKNSTIYKLK
ncbi:uroporphyrinogen decarboxylase family protein [Methanococcus voltae]|uniref:Uroporphyrinogen-III decarboxylase-like protein n=1 Tax=Methanococcus voltae (strain ATCC BAA-1334 / A3) TaxID=456320 RepID=D7DQV9_METV3|nr:uroporphyrinogen decarboxylase family protein [Methanococcus voltae]MCS3900896.1 uroporphyrinogen-III decarboxylase [Methanococcus voltae]